MNPVSNPLPANIMPTAVRTGDGVSTSRRCPKLLGNTHYVIEITAKTSP
jgi:hypothetical protein